MKVTYSIETVMGIRNQYENVFIVIENSINLKWSHPMHHRFFYKQLRRWVNHPPWSNPSLKCIRIHERRLEDNWFDTREALAEVSDAELEKMKIPLKIISLLKDKVRKSDIQPKIQL